MNIQRRWVASGLVTALFAAGPAGAVRGDDLQGLMNVVPQDAAISIVINNLEQMDKSLVAAVNGIDPTSGFTGVLAEIKGDLPIAAWVDFSKPIALIQMNVGGGEGVMIVSSPQFAEKAKGVANAKEEDGLWSLPFEGGMAVYAKLKGGFVLASQSAEAVGLVHGATGVPADAASSRLELLKNRDAVIHLNFEPIRPLVAQGLNQLSAMAPMIAMMSVAQGADPAATGAVVMGAVDGFKRLVDQVSHLDVVLGVGQTNGSITLAAGFKEGEIHTYLARQKPASAPLLTEFEEQPYLAAMGCHIPGTESPFFDFLFDKLAAGTAAAPAMPGTPPPTPDPAKLEAAKAAMQGSRDLYRKVEGWNSLLAFGPGGIRMAGDYIGADAAGILDLAKKNLTSNNPMAKSFSGGSSYEALGESKIGEVSVERFALKLDTSNPAAARAAAFLGSESKFYFGLAGGKARYCMGTEQDAQKAFAAQTKKPLASSKFVVETLSAMPAQRNVVILLDPAGVLPLVGPMIGRPVTEPLPPSQPVGISVSLCGDPARVDIHVPFKAIAKVVEALKPAPPPAAATP